MALSPFLHPFAPPAKDESGFVTIVARLLAATFADADDVLSGLR